MSETPLPTEAPFVPVTKAMVLAQLAEVGVTEAKFNAMSAAQKGVAIQNVAYAHAAYYLGQHHKANAAYVNAQVQALKKSIEA